MSEQEWLACADHQPMLEFLHGRAGGRKLRLFAVACCRRYGRMLGDSRCREAVLAAERFADGRAAAGELAAAEQAVWGAVQSEGLAEDGPGPAYAYCCYRADDGSYPSGIAREVANLLLVAAGDEVTSDEEYDAECARLSRDLHCLFGNPFRPVTPDPSWRAVNAVALARTVYEERRWELLPLLADLLEEAGCPQAVSEHCRGGGPHVRGC